MGSSSATAIAIPQDEWVEPLRFRPRHLRVVEPDERSAPVVLAARPAPAAPYGRRRLVAGLLVVLVAAAAAQLVSHAFASTPTPTPAPAPRAATVQTHVVAPGETVWSIATAMAGPGHDARPVVDALVHRHGGPTLHVGEVVAVPVPE